METKERLGPEAWIEAGVIALIQAGIEAVRVETLAKSLGVTKGSFYWHFKDRRELCTAMLAWWEEKATLSVIAEVEAAGGDARARLKRLIELCTAGRGDQLEGAIRAWGSSDPDARASLERVDDTRERFVIELFRELGFSREVAVRRARILYLALIGEFTWTTHGGKPSGRPVWTELYALLIEDA